MCVCLFVCLFLISFYVLWLGFNCKVFQLHISVFDYDTVKVILAVY